MRSENREKAGNKIRELVKASGKHPWDINCGDCEDFAEDLAEFLGEGAEVLWIDEVDSDWTEDDDDIRHAVVRFDGYYYDSEEPYGVKDWRHLPLCARALREREEERMRTNSEGLTYSAWLTAANVKSSASTYKAWEAGNDPKRFKRAA